jgi:hypothetical protein
MSFFERAINLLPDLKLHRFLENGPGKRERMKFAIFTARVNVGRQ